MGCPHGDEPQRCATCLRAQVARLEAERSRLHGQMGVAWGMYNRSETLLIAAVREAMEAQAQNEAMAAALTEVKEQARKALTWCKANHLGIALTCAALDALKVPALKVKP